jgi:hypothetical protein
MSGKSVVNDALRDELKDANVAAPSATRTAIYQTSTKFLKDVAAQKDSRDIVSPASFFLVLTLYR